MACAKNEIGLRIAKLREKASLSQKELAGKLNVSRETVAKWENSSRDLKTEHTIALADYFGVTCDEILRGVEAKNVNVNRRLGLTDKAITRFEQLRTRRHRAVDFTLIDLVNYLAESANTDIAMSINALIKIPKGESKTEELELLEYYHMGNLYKKILLLVDKVREEIEIDTSKREELRAVQEGIAQEMRAAVTKGGEANAKKEI